MAATQLKCPRVRGIIMDNRVLMWLAVAMIWLLLYQAWQRDYGPQRPVQEQTQTQQDETDQPPLPQIDAPPTLSNYQVDQSGNEGIVTTENAVVGTDVEQFVTVKTDVYDLKISLKGANLFDVQLRNYPKAKNQPEDKVTLLEQNTSSATSLQSGLLASDGQASPTHSSMFSAAQSEYVMEGGQDELDVTFTWQQDGISVDKIYRFRRGYYSIVLENVVSNQSGADWKAAQYSQLKDSGAGVKRSMVDVDSYSFVGAAVYDGNSFEKYDLKDLVKNPIDFDAEGGWVANIRHHFLSAAIPPTGEIVKFQSRTPQQSSVLVSGVAPLHTVSSGSEHRFTQQLFVGPKLQTQMDEISPGLKLSVDYGMLTILAQPVFWLLNKIHSVVGNWGWSIVLLTVLIKLLFYPLAEKAGRSSAKMRTIAPRLKALQERYKDDKQAQSKAMMELYKKEKINPASGCLPILIQMPVFFALYWVLIESVELRQAPFIGWIQDLSSRDPFFILPMIMAGAMFVQTKLNPKPPDPTMAKVMTFMPLVMSVFFVFFPAGLVLYWVVNTVLSVLQQWRINKMIEKAAA